MSLREQVQDAVNRGAIDEIEAMFVEDSRALRHLVGMTYRDDAVVCATAARAIGLAARRHPKKVKEIITRQVWAMESGANTNAVNAPMVLEAIANEAPEMFLRLVTDLAQLAQDPSLQPGIARVLKIVAERCPGQVGRQMAAGLNAKGVGCATNGH